MTTRKCGRYARERHANVKSLHACVFLLSNSEKLRENIQNNTKTKQQDLGRLWLHAMFFYGKASCSRHFAQWRLFVRCCENVTTSAYIGCFVPASFHLIFIAYTS